jgi:hypothetical protein
MAVPTLTPKSQSSKVVLPASGSYSKLHSDGAGFISNYPFAVYVQDEGQESNNGLYDANFISGASDQVAYTYKKLGGDVLDIELSPGNVYTAYQEAVLEYSYQINIHQAKNVLSDLLGMTTGTFNHNGQMIGSSSVGGTPSSINLRYPRFEFRNSRRIGDGVSQAAGFGGALTEYSASFKLFDGQQDYDLQDLIKENSTTTDPATGDVTEFAGLIGDKKVTIRKVFYKTPQAVWRFYGYYGGLNVVGNMNNYGQFADDTTFEIIPAWHNKLQAMAYEDHLWTRLSHFSYKISNNKLRLYPSPSGDVNSHMWVTFTIQKDAWDEDDDRTTGVKGINNMNTLPFDNIPYKNINAIGKQWIRRYALALAKEMLGQIRGKFSSIPIPGESITMNASDLLGQSANEQTALKEELKKILDEMTYRALTEKDAAMVTANSTIQEEVPLLIYQG